MNKKADFKRMNSLHVVYSLISGLLLLAAAMCFLKWGINRHDMIMAFFAGFGILCGTILVCVSAVYACILLYRIWSILQEDTVRTTPEKAIGFLFIPFFNVYWNFVVYYGLAVDFNRYVQKRKLNIALLSVPLFLATCILPIASLVPYVMYVAFPANLIVDIIVLYQILARYNALIDKKQKIN